MSRAIQRLLKDYRKAEKLVGRSTNEPLVDFTNAASFTSQTYAQTMAQIRREPELTQDEKKYLVAVERGDMATTRRYLDIASRASATLLDSDMPITPININCLDPLGRSALSIAIEYENLEMIELLLSYNIDTGEALLYAIDEEFVEAVELLLQHDDLKQQQQQQKTEINEDNNRYSNNILITDKSNPLFTLAQDALEKQRKEQQQDVTQKFKAAWSYLRPSKSSLLSKHDGDTTVEQETPKSKWSFLLQAVRKKEQQQSVTEQLNLSTSRSYTPDITPVILAAHRDNYEILKILLERGEKVTEPHDVRCDCEKCIVYNKEDSLRHSRSRINAYKALSSPCYISLSSRDPIMTAFDLNRELKRLSRIENEFKQEYEQLADQCQEYSAALLAETRSSKELEIILNYDSENPPVLSETTTEKMNLARLKLAIRYKQKKFVSHSHCQQLLASLWYEGLPGFRRRHVILKIMITALVGLLFPLLAIAYLLMPRSGIGRIMRQPFIKFICHSLSYIFFLILLFVVSLRIDFAKIVSGIEVEMNERRGPPPDPVEIAIMVYVAGFIWAEIKQLYQEGLHQYMADTWNLLDWITNCLYLATIVLRVMAYIKVNQEERDLQQKHFTNHASSLNSHNLSSESVDFATGHYVKRRDWNAWDPTLISEGIFAAANIFSSLKLVYLFTINPHLGPLQISLGRMVNDILKFSVLILLVAFAFACGLNQLFWYYARMKKAECEARMNDETKTNDDEYCAKDIYKHFSNLFESLQTLFWGTFGLIDLQTFQIYKKHTFTMFIGLLMYGVYSSIMIIVLLNMLIAMMSNSYQYIANFTETEWKFARAKLWISYFEEGGTLPPPFNIIPSPKIICYGCLFIYRRIFGCSKRHLRSRWQSIKKILSKINEREIKYQTVIRELVKRYIMKRQQKDQTEGVTEDDLNEIKQDISAFRFEMLEILSTNGFRVQSMKKNPDTGKFEPIEDTNKARVGRKRGKMNLEKTINKNMFDVSTSIRDSNPIQPDIIKNDSVEPQSAPISSLLSHPKQKLTAQFKRAITMMKQRSEPAHESSPPKLIPTISLVEKPDATLLTSLIEEPIRDEPIRDEPPSQSFVHVKPSSKENDLNSATIINLDPVTRLNQQNQTQPIRIIKSETQQDFTPQSSTSSATLSPTPPSSSSTTTTTGYLQLLREGRAPMASPDPLSIASDESCITPDLDTL